MREHGLREDDDAAGCSSAGDGAGGRNSGGGGDGENGRAVGAEGGLVLSSVAAPHAARDGVGSSASSASSSSDGEPTERRCKRFVVIGEPEFPRALAIINFINTDATRWLLNAGGKDFRVDLVVFETEKELFDAAGDDVGFADLSNSYVCSVSEAAIWRSVEWDEKWRWQQNSHLLPRRPTEHVMYLHPEWRASREAPAECSERRTAVHVADDDAVSMCDVLNGDMVEGDGDEGSGSAVRAVESSESEIGNGVEAGSGGNYCGDTCAGCGGYEGGSSGVEGGERGYGGGRSGVSGSGSVISSGKGGCTISSSSPSSGDHFVTMNSDNL